MPVPERSRHPWLLPMMTAGLMAGILLGRSAPAWEMAAVTLAAGGLYTLLCHGRSRGLGAVLIAVSLGALLGWTTWHPVLPEEGMHRVTGVVTDLSGPDEKQHVTATLRSVTIDGEAWRGGMYWSFYLGKDEALPEGLQPGSHVAVTARVYAPSGRDNPNGFDFREYLLQQGIRYGLYGMKELTLQDDGFSLAGSMACLRYVLSQRLIRVMGQEAGGYAAAMLLGSREELPEEDLAAFDRLGISHILSISGYHVGVLAAMLAALCRVLRPKRRHGLVLRILLLTAYCLLTGGRAPVVRAALLSVLYEMSRVRQRQALSLHTLCAAACLQLLFNPALLTGASFQLTYGAMIGLLLLRPKLARLVHTRFSPVNRVWEAFAVCLSAQLGVMPALLYWYGRYQLLSLIVNMIVPFVFTLLMGLYWATLLLLWLPGVREVLGWLSAQVTHILMAAIHLPGEGANLSLWTRQPDFIVLLGFALLFLGLIPILPRRYAHRQRILLLVGVLLAATVCLPLPHGETTYIQFSVGEADAALLHDRDTVAVIDTGENGSSLAAYLRARRLSIDMLLITHLHLDHAGGIADLLENRIPVRHCYLPADATIASIDPELLTLLDQLEASGTQLHTLSRGDVLPLPSGSLTVLWPEEGRTRPLQDANHSSLVLLAQLRGTTLLLTGDLSGTYEKYAAVGADILKAAHHGSSGSTLPAFLAQVHPQAILLSCGTESRETGLTQRTGAIPVYSTHTSGAVTIRFDEGSFRIYPYK